MSLDGLSNRKNIFETGSKYYSTQSSLNYLRNIKNNPINTTIKKEAYNPKLQSNCAKRLYNIKMIGTGYTCTKNKYCNNIYKTNNKGMIHENFISPVKHYRIKDFSNESFKSPSSASNTFSNLSTGTRECNYKTKGKMLYKLKMDYIEKKMHRSLSGQKTENLQFLASPGPELRLEYIHNFGIIQEKPKKVEIPPKPNKIEHINKIEISYENPVKVEQIKKNDETQTYEIIKPKSKNKIEQANKVQIYEKSKKKIKPKIDNIIVKTNKIEIYEKLPRKIETIKPENIIEQTNKVEIYEEPPKEIEPVKNEKIEEEKKEEIKNKENSKNEDSIIIDDDYNKVDKGYMRQVRTKIIKVNQNIEKEDSDSSEYDVLQNLKKYDGEFKYKNIDNQSLESKQRNVINKANKKEIYIKIEEYDLNKDDEDNINSENKEVNSLKNKDNKEPSEEQKNSSERYGNNPEVIQDDITIPEDSPYPGETEDNQEEKKNSQEEQDNAEENENIENIKNDIVDMVLKTKDSPNEKLEKEENYEEENHQDNNEEQEEEEEEHEQISGQESIKEQDEEHELKEEDHKIELNEEQEQNEEHENVNESENDNGSNGSNNKDILPKRLESYEIEENNGNIENNQESISYEEEKYNSNNLGEIKEKKEGEKIEKEVNNKNLFENQEILKGCGTDDEKMHENKNGQDKDNELNIKQPLEDIIKEKKNREDRGKHRQKIKVYSFYENNEINGDNTQESDSLIVFIKSSVKKPKNGGENYSHTSNSSEQCDVNDTDSLDDEPKNSAPENS